MKTVEQDTIGPYQQKADSNKRLKMAPNQSAIIPSSDERSSHSLNQAKKLDMTTK